MPKKMAYQENLTIIQKIIMGLQHVLTMVPASIAVPLMFGNALNLDPETITFLVSANLFTSGLAILIQVIGVGKLVGAKLPVILGSAFVTLGPLTVIGEQHGLQAVFGSIIGSAVLMFILSFFMDKILKLFPASVMGTIVTLIGITLAPIAMKDIGGGELSSNYGSIKNLLLGFFVLVIIILIGRFTKGMVRSFSLLIGLVLGTLVAATLGMVDIDPVIQSNWFRLVTPFKFGLPIFKIDSIIIMTLFSIINMIQCIGLISVLDEVTGIKTSNQVKKKGIRAQIISQSISGIFNSVPSSMFNENVGLIDLTKIKDKSVIKIAGIILVFLGIFPKFSAIITMIPKPVLGGATLTLFGVITSAGISMLSKLDFSADNNSKVIGTSIAIGVGTTFAPEIFIGLPSTLEMLLSNGLFTVTVSAIILNLVLNLKNPKQV